MSTTNGFLYDPHSEAHQTRAHAIYRELRDRHPVYHNPERGIWAISRFEDVWNATLDVETLTTEGIEEAQILLPMLNFLDPPRHDRLRALVSRAFTHRRVQEMEPRIRDLARTLLDAADTGSTCDLLTTYAEPLPGRVIASMIGVPEERRETFLGHTRQMLATDPNKSIAEIVRDPSERIYAEFRRVLDERRSGRQDDLMSALLDAEIDGERLGDDEILGFCYQLIVAGNDTTTTLIGNGAVLLAQHPEQRERLAALPSLIPAAVEEMLRYESPPRRCPAARGGTCCSTASESRRVRACSWCGPPPTATSASSKRPTASTSAARSAATWPSVTASTPAWARRSHDSRPGWRSRSCWRGTPPTSCARSPAGSPRAGRAPTRRSPWSWGHRLRNAQPLAALSG